MQYINPDWKSLLTANHIDDMSRVWQLSLDLVDTPNLRRDGYSEVGKFYLQDNKATVFIKRQHNYTCRSRHFPWQKIPTLKREYQNIQAFQRINIPVPEMVFYDDCTSAAILGVAELEHSCDLLMLYRVHNATFIKILPMLATLIAHMHQQGWQHTALYPKHIFVNTVTHTMTFIDLEGCRKRWCRRAITIRDLDSLNRHMPNVSIYTRARFLKYYLKHLNQLHQFKPFFRKLCKRYQLKRP